MKPTNEKIELHEFAEKFFNIKVQPYQRYIIKLLGNGKIKRLQILPTTPYASIKHLDFIKELVEQYVSINTDKLIREGLLMQEVSVSHKPTLLTIDDIEAPFRNLKWMKYAQPIKHELGIVAVKATIL